MKSIIIADANNNHRKTYQKLSSSLATSIKVLAYTSSYIDTKEKLLEYVPDLLILDNDFQDGDAGKVLQLLQEHNLSIKAYVISEDISYQNVRKCFLQGAKDYISFPTLSIEDIKNILHRQDTSDFNHKNEELEYQIQQILGLIKDKQQVNKQVLFCLLMKANETFQSPMQMIYFRIDRIHEVYAHSIKDRSNLRNIIYGIIHRSIPLKHSIYFSKNHSGIILMEMNQLDTTYPYLQDIITQIYQQFRFTITFIISNTFLGIEEFYTTYQQLTLQQDAKFYHMPGRIITKIPSFHRLQIINPMYQRKRFSSMYDISKDNLDDFLTSTLHFFQDKNIEPMDVRDFYIYTLTKINIITQDYGMKKQFPFEEYLLAIRFCEYFHDLHDTLSECFQTLLIWIEKTAAPYSIKVQTIVSIIQEHPEQKYTLEQLASYLHITPVHLSRIFKKETGITLIGYINQIKVEKACEYIKNSNLSIQEISLSLGFQNQFYFNKVFHQQMKMSPTAYRNQV